MKLYPARAQTTLYQFHIACMITGAGKMDATLMPGAGGRRFGFWYLFSRHCNTRMGLPTLLSCYIAVIFLLLDVTVVCKPTNASKATRQLFYPVLLLISITLDSLRLSWSF